MPALPTAQVQSVSRAPERTVWVGHPWAGKTPAQIVIFEGRTKRTHTLARNHDRHVLSHHLEGDLLTLVMSDASHVVHGTAIIEATLQGKKARATAPLKVNQIDRHAGKGHASLSLRSLTRRAGKLFGLASVSRTHFALLELTRKPSSFTARVLTLLPAHSAGFTAEGDFAVLANNHGSLKLLGLDGSVAATLKVPQPATVAWSWFSKASRRRITLGTRLKGLAEYGELTVTTTAWPEAAGVTRALESVPEGYEVIDDLPVGAAARCSPEPTSYDSTKPRPPRAWGAVTGWGLNRDPSRAKPTISHAMITDLIINFFAVSKGTLRLLFNFSLRAITKVSVAAHHGDDRAPRSCVRVEITTPSGLTVLLTTPTFARTLREAIKKR